MRKRSSPSRNALLDKALEIVRFERIAIDPVVNQRIWIKPLDPENSGGRVDRWSDSCSP
jgi:hypothetical protein